MTVSSTEKTFDAPIEEGRLSYRGGVVEYSIYGQGTPLLLSLPLFPRHGSIDFLKPLTLSFRLIIPTFIPPASKDVSTPLLDYDRLADAYSYLLKRLDIDRLPLVGMDEGATAALVFAELYRPLIDRIALVNPALHVSGLHPRLYTELLRSYWKSLFADSQCRELAGLPFRSMHLSKSALSGLSVPLLLSFSSSQVIRKAHQALIKSALPTSDVTLCDFQSFPEKLSVFLQPPAAAEEG